MRRRLVVADDGVVIRLAMYGDESPTPLAEVVLAPGAALRLLADLSAAAVAHLSRRSDASATSARSITQLAGSIKRE